MCTRLSDVAPIVMTSQVDMDNNSEWYLRGGREDRYLRRLPASDRAGITKRFPLDQLGGRRCEGQRYAVVLAPLPFGGIWRQALYRHSGHRPRNVDDKTGPC